MLLSSTRATHKGKSNDVQVARPRWGENVLGRCSKIERWMRPKTQITMCGFFCLEHWGEGGICVAIDTATIEGCREVERADTCGDVGGRGRMSRSYLYSEE